MDIITEQTLALSQKIARRLKDNVIVGPFDLDRGFVVMRLRDKAGRHYSVTVTASEQK